MRLAKDLRDIKRFEQIIKALFKYELGFLIQKLHLKEHLTLKERLQKDKFKEKEVKPYLLRKAMEDLGGAFVKLGQILSLRPDLIPLEYVKEFEKLQDNVPAFSYELVRKTIESELKKPIDEIFESFEQKPIAAASIAQVHKAKLKSGELVAVKVMRPNIQEIMQKDTEIMLIIAKILEKHDYKFKNYSPIQIVKEFQRWTSKELDFRIEAKNAKIFRHNFEKSKTVYIPKVYEKFSTEKVLVLEFLDAIEFHDIKKVKRKNIKIDKILKNGFEAILTQIYVHGVFHADPHPGNILILKDGRISFVDFGIVGYFDDNLKNFSLNIFEGIIENDVDKIIQTLVDVGLADKDSLFRIELEEIIEPLQGASIQDVKISEVLEEVMNLSYHHNVKFPVDFILFGKTLVTLEGVALEYSPKFKLVNSAKPFLKKLIRQQMEPQQIVKRMLKNTAKMKKFVFDIPEKTSLLLRGMKEADRSMMYIDKDLRNLTAEIDKSSNRLSISLIITGLIIASVLTLPYNQYTVFGISSLSFFGFLLTGILALLLLISISREKKSLK